jgi:hypothetical protein
MSVTDPRLQRGAGWLVAAGVVALMLLGTSRSFATIAVANGSITSVVVNAGTSSAAFNIPSSAGNPTHLTVTDKTANDGIRGIAAIALSYVPDAPQQSIVWTGTARGAVVGGEAKAANVVLGSCGVGVSIQTELSGANLKAFKIVNISGVPVTVTIHQVW